MCKAKPPENIKLLSFNVEGLKPKLEDPNFLEFVNNYDISILTETWKSEPTKINIEGFWDYSQVRPKHKNAIRHSGGITILARYNIRPGLKLIEDTEGFLWFCLKKSFFKIENDIYICGAYIPPANTTANITSKTDYFGNLEKSLLKYKSKGNVIIMGDLNARIGNKDNTLNKKLNEDLGHLLPSEKESYKSQNRSSCDNAVNTAGRKLIKLCNNYNLRVANGQTPGDRLGNYTCFNNGGASVVDYLLMEDSLNDNILNFIVLPPEFDSKHAPITTTFKTPKLSTEERKLFNLPKSYKWDNNRKEVFQSLLSGTKKQLESLCDQLKSGNKSENIQEITKSFTKILTDCADKSLKLKGKKNT